MKAFVKFNSQQILRYFGHRISKPAKGFQNVLLFRDTYICVRKTEYGFKDFLVSQIVDHVSFTEVNSQAPDVPELAHQGIFQLSRLSVNCYVKTTKKCSLYLSRTDFLKILLVLQDHCGSHNNFMKFFSKIIHFMVFTYF